MNDLYKILVGWLPIPVIVAIALFGTVLLANQEVGNALLLALVGAGSVIFIRLLTSAIAVVIDEITRGTKEDIVTWLRERKIREPYLQHMIFAHRFFDVKGMINAGRHDVELEQVFVDLNISQEDKSGENLVIARSSERAMSIWEHMARRPNDNFVILGVPGCGKTTLLKFIALTLANRTRRAPKFIPNKLPILLFLRDHTEAIVGATPPTLAACVLQGLHYRSERAKPPIEWFERNLEAGRCLVMFDGLDEVADAADRKEVVKWVEQQMKANPNNRFIITSRPRGYRSNPIEGVFALDIMLFNSEQVKKFVNNWYLATEIVSKGMRDEGVELDAERGATELLRRIRSSDDLAKLAVNPLLLTMIALVHRWRSSLPGRRVELYEEMCNVFLGKRAEAQGVPDNLTPLQKQSVLQPLSYRMLTWNKRSVNLQEMKRVITPSLRNIPNAPDGEGFVQILLDRSGILIEREVGVYEFAHKTFQEFMAAVHIEKNPRLLGELVSHVNDDWWHETIRLYCARADATPIIEACLSHDPLSIPTLRLALECMDEALTLSPDVRDRLQPIIYDSLESEEPARRRLAAETLLALRLKRLIRQTDDRLIDSQPITNAEYQQFVDEILDGEPPHWHQPQFPAGAARAAVVGMTGYAARRFVEWLTERERDSEWRYRLPHKDEIETREAYWVQEGDLKPRAGGQRSQPLSAIAGFRTTERDLSAYPIEMNSLLIDTNRTSRFGMVFSDTRDRTLNFVLERARDLALALDHAGDLARDLARARDLALDIARALDRDLALDIARALDRDLALARALDRDLALALARTLAYDVALIYLRAWTEKGSLDDNDWQLFILIGLSLDDSAYMLHRLLLLPPKLSDDLIARVNSLLKENLHAPPPRALVGKQSDYEAWKQDVDALAQMVAALVTVKQRRAGAADYPAYEHLYIVKERVKK
jgi:nucleoside-triphosphatase THEP1